MGAISLPSCTLVFHPQMSLTGLVGERIAVVDTHEIAGAI